MPSVHLESPAPVRAASATGEDMGLMALTPLSSALPSPSSLLPVLSRACSAHRPLPVHRQRVLSYLSSSPSKTDSIKNDSGYYNFSSPYPE